MRLISRTWAGGAPPGSVGPVEDEEAGGGPWVVIAEETVVESEGSIRCTRSRMHGRGLMEVAKRGRMLSSCSVGDAWLQVNQGSFVVFVDDDVF